MAINQPNPQRGVGARKPAPAGPPAAGGRPGMPRPRPGGAPAAAPVAGAKRPPLRAAVAPPKGGGGKGNKILVLVILLLLAGMIAYGFIPRGGKPPLFIALARHYGLFKGSIGAKTEGEDPSLSELDKRYNRALGARQRAKTFLEDQQKFAEQPDLLTEAKKAEVVRELQKFRGEVESGVDDLGRVADAAGKETTIEASAAKEEQKKQKAFTIELGNALLKWQGPKDQIFSKEPEFVAKKFDPVTSEKKPGEKKDPNRGATVVAPATPTDIPKPAESEKPKEEPKPEPEKPKEDPKPEPKPEPEKPKPAEPKPEGEKPKPEPEKPKEVAKADPKPEPEKPKEEPKPEPKPEPEKPKPAEPKPEPEKPKEEPKPEPKPEPKVARKIDVVVAEADQLVLEGTPMAREVLSASKSLPDDPEKLKTLSMKLETAQAFFVKARESYSEVKESAPPAADVASKLGKIEKILSILQNAADGIKSKLK